MRDLKTADIHPILAIFIGLASLTFFWYFQAAGSASDEMSALEAWVIPLFMLAMIAVQGVMLVVGAILSRRFLGSNVPVYLLAAAMFAFNFFSTFLGHLGLFLVQDDWVKAVVLVLAFGFAFILASEAYESRAMRIGIVVVGPLLLAGGLAGVMLSGDGAMSRRIPMQAELTPGQATDAGSVRKVAFAKRRNVYLISFDAMAPDAIVDKYVGITPPLKYSEALVANGARVLTNAFADREPTKPSLNSMLALDVEWFDALPEADKYNFFTGRRRSPAGEIFRHNGYGIQTMYRNNYFGRRQGPYVDFYGVTNIASVCDHVESRLGFLGYCTRQTLAVMQWLIPAIDRSVSSHPYLEFVLERIRFAAQDERPWLTIAYIFSPGHADQSFDYRRARDRDAYRALFDRNQEMAASEVNLVLTTIRQADPDSIVLVFGDHGPLMSRGTEFADDPTFFVHDRHAVRMAIWPAEACRRELDDAARGGFITIAQALRAIVTCLSDGIDPIEKPVAYSLPYGNRNAYVDYLYEERAGAPAR